MGILGLLRLSTQTIWDVKPGPAVYKIGALTAHCTISPALILKQNNYFLSVVLAHSLNPTGAMVLIKSSSPM